MQRRCATGLCGVAILLLAASIALSQQPDDTAGSRPRLGVHSHALTTDGRTLALGGFVEVKEKLSGEVRLWDVITGKELLTFKGPRRTVWSLAFSPDGRTLAAGSGDPLVTLWDLTTGKELRTLRGHRGWVYDVLFSPDGKTLASGDGTGLVKLWEAATGRELASFKSPSSAIQHHLAFSPDGKTLAVAGYHDQVGAIKLWTVATATEGITLRGDIKSEIAPLCIIAFSPDGKLLASILDSRRVILWDVATGRRLRTFRNEGLEPRALTFSPNGKTLACSYFNTTVNVWDVASGKMLATRKADARAVPGMMFMAGGKTLVVIALGGTRRNRAELWDWTAE